MPGDTYSIVTVDSEIHEDEDDHVDREEEEKILTRRRWLKLASIVIVFLVCGLILAMSVVHDVEARAGDDLEGEEFTCPDNNDACVSLLCPEGMVWEVEEISAERWLDTPAVPPALMSTCFMRQGRKGRQGRLSAPMAWGCASCL